jgi:hypothetical protein
MLFDVIEATFDLTKVIHGVFSVWEREAAKSAAWAWLLSLSSARLAGEKRLSVPSLVRQQVC